MIITLLASACAGFFYARLHLTAFSPSLMLGLFIVRLVIVSALAILLLHTSLIRLILGLMIFFATAWYHILKGHNETGSF